MYMQLFFPGVTVGLSDHYRSEKILCLSEESNPWNLYYTGIHSETSNVWVYFEEWRDSYLKKVKPSRKISAPIISREPQHALNDFFYKMFVV